MVQHVSVDLPDGARIAVEMEGRGAPLLLVFGLGGTAAFWGAAARCWRRRIASSPWTSAVSAAARAVALR